MFLRRKIHPVHPTELVAEVEEAGGVGREQDSGDGASLRRLACHSLSRAYTHTVTTNKHTHISIESANSPLSEVSESLGGIGLYASDLRAN